MTKCWKRKEFQLLDLSKNIWYNCEILQKPLSISFVIIDRYHFLKIASVAGARPNFVKLAPIHRAIKSFSDHTIIHTGQHYDYGLSEIFFQEFDLPPPDIELEVGSGGPGFQTGEMIKRLENVFLDSKFEIVLVYGDTNSTFAGAFAATKAGLRVAHVEAGLRSFDRKMPEEINRILTDHISDHLFAPTFTALKNLEREHVFGKVLYTGDLSVEIIKDAVKLASRSSILDNLKLKAKSYMLFTMHRAENTDYVNNMDSVIRVFETLLQMGEDTRIIFPIHPRTTNKLKRMGLYERLENCENVVLLEPIGYVDFIKLMLNAQRVITDSGGIQKESYLLGVPCITIRNNTEWVETLKDGWNILTGTDTDKIVKAIVDANLNQSLNTPGQQIFGSGRTSEIIKDTLKSIIQDK
jgi:UDP-N-acetylglucosamine 2-epimerase